MARMIEYKSVDVTPAWESPMFNSIVEDSIIQMLNEAAPLLVEDTKRVLEQTIDGDSGHKGAINNYTYSKAKKAKNGAFIVNTHTKGRTDNYYYNNGRKVPVYHDDALKWLEYGREGQPARPWVEKATRRAEKHVLNKMQEVYNKNIK